LRTMVRKRNELHWVLGARKPRGEPVQVEPTKEMIEANGKALAFQEPVIQPAPENE
jgi:hypothetical protein